MEETNVTVSEAQLKGRRTSLGKKSNEELINIILRKDRTERNNNAKIKQLQDGNAELLSKIDYFNNDIITKRDKINTQYEQINNMKADMGGTLASLEYNKKEVQRLKDKCNLLRKTVWSCFAIIFVLLIFIVLGF